MQSSERRGPGKGCGLAVFGVFIAVVACCCGASQLVCSSRLSDHTWSPDGRYLVVTHEVACGATAEGGITIRIADARVPEVLLEDPLWLSKQLLSDVLLDSTAGAVARFEWTQPRTLLIRCSTAADYRQSHYRTRRTEWHDVRI